MSDESKKLRNWAHLRFSIVGPLLAQPPEHGELTQEIECLSQRSYPQWYKPKALYILDDRSRLCCHIQWYQGESADELIHGLIQAFQKRGLPRSLLTDNGSAMKAGETGNGLLGLGIVHSKTLPYSPMSMGIKNLFGKSRS